MSLSCFRKYKFNHALVLIGILVLMNPAAQAYVFAFKEAKIGSYIGATGGMSDIGGSPYANSSGTGNSVSGTISRNFSGELGLLYHMGGANLLFGAEFLSPQGLNGGVLTNSSGTQLGTVDSSVYGILGDVGLEFNLRQRKTSHFIFGVTGTYANVTYSNNYDLNSTGVADYPGVSSSYSVLASGWGFGGKTYFGFEYLFTDNVTANIVVGYRYLPLYSFTNNQSEDTVNGQVTKGSPAVNSDGSRIKMNLSGPFVGFGFRFYFL